MGDLAVGTYIAEWQLEILQTCALARCHEEAASLLRVFSRLFSLMAPRKVVNCFSTGLSSYCSLLWHEF